MIQATGTVPSSNGIASYTNPLINVYLHTSSKFSPTIAVAQVGKIISQGEENENFDPVEQICTSAFDLKNPSFEVVQNLLLADLKDKYPAVTFEII
jgi:hypothetical protein